MDKKIQDWAAEIIAEPDYGKQLIIFSEFLCVAHIYRYDDGYEVQPTPQDFFDIADKSWAEAQREKDPDATPEEYLRFVAEWLYEETCQEDEAALYRMWRP